MAILLNSSLQDQLPQLARKLSEIGPDDVPKHIRECLSKENGEESHSEMHQELLHLLSPDIQKYVEYAYIQAWPFLPPTMDPTIMREPNSQIPKLSQVEVLLLSLNFAFESENYKMALSIAFVVDRYVYWCNGSAALLNIVDQIKKLAPELPVAPQLVIRKARVMKDNGDLHGSIQILNNLIEQRPNDYPTADSPSRWEYKAKDQYDNVCAVCVQIKGQIYHNLGLWKDAISPLKESIERFQALPEEDLKGSSYSYGLLSRCLSQLSRMEYQELHAEYQFRKNHQWLEAYEMGQIAVKKSPNQRLFRSKHLLQCGEIMLMILVQNTVSHLDPYLSQQELELLQHWYPYQTVHDLCEVLDHQNPEEYYRSKDQLFIFIKALFVTCLILGCSDDPVDRDLGYRLETICLFVYGKFCDISDNQLDSAIGTKNLTEIIPALNFALKIFKQKKLDNYRRSIAENANDRDSSSKGLEKDILVDSKQLSKNIKMNYQQEHIAEISSGKDPWPVNSETDILGRSIDQKERTLIRGNTIENWNAETQKRVMNLGRSTPIVDCKAGTQGRLGTPWEGTPMVDCRAETKGKLGTPGEGTPMVDCRAETKERLGTPGEGTPMVDCRAETKERLGTPGEGTPMVDCRAETKEKLGTHGEGTAMVDCKAETKEKLGTPWEGTPMVDCKSETKERLGTHGVGTPMVDCKSETKERLGTHGVGTPMVDCRAKTKERLGTPGEGTPMVDCRAETKERLGTPGEGTPMVDCRAETKERLGTPGEGTPMVDCRAETKERLGTPGEGTPMVDCRAEFKERLGISYGLTRVLQNFYDSALKSLQSLFQRRNENSELKPRLVGSPCSVSSIQSKVSSFDRLYRNFEDFYRDTDSSALQSKDESLVNTSALTSICQSRQDGTFLANRLLNKFQSRESPYKKQLRVIRVSEKYPTFTTFLGSSLPESWFELFEIHFNRSVPSLEVDSVNQDGTVNKIHKATLYQYNPVTCIWSGQDTIARTGKELTLGKGKKGNFRNVYQINFLHQDEPLGKYVSKRYRQQRESLQYMDDVVCQMQAGLYVNRFNQALMAFETDLRIHFLRAAFMLLYDSDGNVQDWMNVEPFVDGEFLKLTNNYDFCNPRGKDVSTSFIHFTYVQSEGKMMVSDLQGWLPAGTQNLIYLTDPQFHTHSGDSSPFDFGEDGMKKFFEAMHPECNLICKVLNLSRPNL